MHLLANAAEAERYLNTNIRPHAKRIAMRMTTPDEAIRIVMDIMKIKNHSIRQLELTLVKQEVQNMPVQKKNFEIAMKFLKAFASKK